MREEAELHPAYQWDCPNCGRENFERVVVPDNYESWMVPSEVKCNCCESLFSSYDQFGDYDPQEDTGPAETNI